MGTSVWKNLLPLYLVQNTKLLQNYLPKYMVLKNKKKNLYVSLIDNCK
jgi:hypothetical protein